jgi:pfkB family carbohydrate kinase
VPPYWAQDAPVDTCGAGDAYAAGVLWAYLRGMGIAAMGRAGARVASQVDIRDALTLLIMIAKMREVGQRPSLPPLRVGNHTSHAVGGRMLSVHDMSRRLLLTF